MDLQALAVATDFRLALQRAGVRFCHWKSNDHLAEALTGETDIDLFAAPADAAAFEQAAVETGALRILSQPWARYPQVEDWLLFDQASGGFLHLHVHFALMTGLKRVKHLQIPWGEALLAHLRHDQASGWPIPAAEMELLILLVRIWAKMPPWRRLTRPKIPPHIMKELDWLRGSADPAALAGLADELGLRVDRRLLLGLLGKEPMEAGEIIAVASALNDGLRSHHRMAWPAALLLAGLRNSWMALARAGRRLGRPVRTGKTIPGGGLMIALVGSDGSGKSTLTRDIEKWLRYKLDAHTFYMGSGDGGSGLFDMLRRGIRRGARKSRGAGGNGAKKKSGFVAKLIELHQLVLMRHKLRLLRLARRMAQSGSVILTDRYPQSQFHGISDGPKLQDGRGFAWAARAELRLYEEAARLGPDLLVKLSVDPQTAHSRKPDHDLSVIARKCAIIDQLDFPQSQRVIIDARAPYADVLLATKRAIWVALKEGPGTW